MTYNKVQIPAYGSKITVNKEGIIHVPNAPIIPFIEGDGIGIDITPVMLKVINAAVKKAYQGLREIQWMEIYAGEKSKYIYGDNIYLPEETLEIIRNFIIAIKSPLTTPISGGIRSINVALRQKLDLYICLRPIRYFSGTPSPLCSPEKTNMTIFRENSEDIYSGIEWAANSEEVKKLIKFLHKEMNVKEIRFPETSGIGIKPISSEGSKRLIHKAIQYAIDNNCPSVTLVHKGNIMKFTEGAFKKWGYEVAREDFEAVIIPGKDPWCKIKNPVTNKDILIKDVIADNFFQQIILHPQNYSVIATMNLNGDYISDALAAQVGGVGIAPGANLSNKIALFEATHGTAPKYAGKNKVNPSSIILSAEMMLRYMKWTKAADLIIHSISKTIKSKTVTYDLAQLMKDPVELSCSGFGDAIINNMDI